MRNRKTFTHFWSFVQVGEPHECWPWLGGKAKGGYGLFQGERGHSVYAHRKAFEYAEGQKAKKWVLHECDNPPCCNPSHLYDGTSRDNIMDCIARGRFKTVYVKGEDHPNAKLTNSQIADAFKRIALGEKQINVARSLGVSTSTITYHKRRLENA